MREGIVRTICPGCLKIFNACEELDVVRCNFCEHIYELPKLKGKYRGEKIN